MSGFLFLFAMISLTLLRPMPISAQAPSQPKRVTWVGVETFETAYTYGGRTSGVLGYANDYAAKTVVSFIYVQDVDAAGNSKFISQNISWSSHGRSVANGYETTTCDGSGNADVLGHDADPIKIHCETDSAGAHWGFFPHPPSSISPPKLVSWDQLRHHCVYSEEDYGTYSRHTYTVTVCGTENCGGPTAGCRAPDRHFQQGQELIQANCAECLGATKRGLQQGVAEIELALKQGYGDKLAAYKLLADAYNTLAIVYAQDRSQEQTGYRDKRQQMYQQAIALAPEDARLRYEYAMTLRDAGQQISLLHESIGRDPNYADAHYALGVLLLSGGNRNDGIRELQTALRLTDREHAQSYANRLIDALNDAGRKGEIPDVMQQLQQKLRRPN